MPVLNYIEQSVDIRSFPSIHPILHGRNGDEIVIGDLHANTIKLFYFLIRHGVIHRMTEAQYAFIVAICSKSAEDLTRDDLNEYKERLRSLCYNKNVTVSLIGDELADRTDTCDVLTMLLIRELREYQVPVKIHLSNHTSQMIEACELKTGFTSTMLSARDCLSMRGIDTIIRNGLMTADEIYVLYEEYKKAFRVNSYFIDFPLVGKAVMYLMNHAAIDLINIRHQTEFLLSSPSLPPVGSPVSLHELTATLDGIDKKFRIVVSGNWIHDIYEKKSVEYAYAGLCDLRDDCFAEVMWNRKYDSLKRAEDQGEFLLRYIHGHDDGDQDVENVCNLDNILGKSAEHCVGDYSIIYHTRHPLPQDFVENFEFYKGKAPVALRKRRIQERTEGLNQLDLRTEESSSNVTPAEMSSTLPPVRERLASIRDDLGLRREESNVAGGGAAAAFFSPVHLSEYRGDERCLLVEDSVDSDSTDSSSFVGINDLSK